MKRVAVIVSVVLVIVALVSPMGAGAARAKPVATTGSMSMQSTWPAGPGGLSDRTYYTFAYAWTATGPDGTKPAKGSLTLTVSHKLADGTTVVDAVAKAAVAQVVRVSATTVDLWTDLGNTYRPGDPAHASSRFRVVDNGMTGDLFRTYCYIDSYPPPLEVFHTLSTTGVVKVR